MCTYKDIENIELPNGKTVKEVNAAMRREIEKIYMESWQKGLSVPFFDNEGNIYLANPYGSEDYVSLEGKTRTQPYDQPHGAAEYRTFCTSDSRMKERRPELTIIAKTHINYCCKIEL